MFTGRALQRMKNPRWLCDVGVLTAQEDGASEFPDPALLDRVTALQRVLFTYDDDFFAEAARRQGKSVAFSGIVFAKPLRITVGRVSEIWRSSQKPARSKTWLDRCSFLPL